MIRIFFLQVPVELNSFPKSSYNEDLLTSRRYITATFPVTRNLSFLTLLTMAKENIMKSEQL